MAATNQGCLSAAPAPRRFSGSKHSSPLQRSWKFCKGTYP